MSIFVGKRGLMRYRRNRTKPGYSSSFMLYGHSAAKRRTHGRWIRVRSGHRYAITRRVMGY